MRLREFIRKKEIKQIVAKVAVIVFLVMSVFTTAGCSIASIVSTISEIKGDLVGNSFECQFYDNYGGKSLFVSGTKINFEGNRTEELSYDSDGDVETIYSLSSVVTINIDGKQIQSCGDTIIFAEEGLKPEADFTVDNIQSTSEGNLSDNTSISSLVNRYKNFFGKSQVVVIKSQMGTPICAYSGDDVNWHVCSNLPKTTKLMIDGKALYIHRANFQIVDKELFD